MDSGNFQPCSQSNINDSSYNQPPIGTHQKTFIDVDQFHGGMIPPNLQFQPSSQVQQQYGPNFSYQSLLNAPTVVYVPAHSQPFKVSNKKKNTPLNSEISPGQVNRRWTLAEDIALTNARLNVSCDAGIGIGQKSETLWSRILQVWRENMREFDPTRDCVSLENRWGRLQAAINKFHGYYELHERSPKSGQALEDVKRDAMRSYQETNKNKPFKHEDCWEICRKNVKWCTKLLTKQDVNKKQKPIVDSSNENSPTSKQAQFDPSFIAQSEEPAMKLGSNCACFVVGEFSLELSTMGFCFLFTSCLVRSLVHHFTFFLQISQQSSCLNGLFLLVS
ncbi:hypothetical protein OROMI_020606 [Orobanche minor]